MDYKDNFLTQKEQESQPSPAKRLAFFIIITVIDTAKIRDNKKNRHLFNIIPHFFLRNENIRRIFAKRFSYKKKRYGQADQ